MYLPMRLCGSGGMWVCVVCVVCACTLLLPPVPLFSSAFVHLCREGLEARTGSSKPSAGRELAPLSPAFALYFTGCCGSRVAGSGAHPPPPSGGCLTLGYSRDMCERGSYFYPALTGCDGSVEEGLSAFQGHRGWSYPVIPILFLNWQTGLLVTGHRLLVPQRSPKEQGEL